MAEEDAPAPRWDIITKGYDKIDGVIDDFVKKDEMNILELSIVFMMVNKRLNQQDMGMYMEYLKEEANKSANDSGLYR
tara:strand:+ start:23 stop:256 length:234 start_codon:yes stop_codon:yes gene_type:complete